MPAATLLATALPAHAVIAAERPRDRARVEALIDRAFGPGRFAKTAERLREGGVPHYDLSFVAWSGGGAMGCVRQWPILIGETQALLLGPIAVEGPLRRQGLGATLVRHACAAATAAGESVILLVGEQAFFGPLGFAAAPAARVRLPGPVDQQRVMARPLRPGAAGNLCGPVRAIAA
jgi:predicted N-acetyltransferase YhbS